MAKNPSNYTDSDAESTDYLAKCRGRIEDAIKWRKNAMYDEKWAKYLKLYGNQYDYPELSQYQDVVAPNMVFSTVNVMVPSIVVNYPKITVTARQQEQVAQASTVEAAANYNWEHFGVHKEVKKCVKDFIIFGHGIAKTTWELKEEEVDLDRDEWRDAVTAALQQVEAAKAQASAQPGVPVTFPTDDEVIQSVPETQTVITADHPTVARVSPFDIYMDPDATDFQDILWIAQRLYVPISVARKDDKYKDSQRKKLVPSAMSEAKSSQETLFEGEDRGSEANYAIIWEYYDLVENTVCYFTMDGCDDFLVDPDEAEAPFAHPYSFVENYAIPEKLYPMGDIDAIFPLQLELALTRTQLINDRKRFRRMYLVNKDKLGPEGLDAFLSGDDNVIIPVDGDTPFSEVFAPVGTSTLPPDFYNQTAMILDDMNLVSGVTEYQRGSVAEVRRTATEAAMIQDMSNARSADKLATVEQFIGDVAKKTVQLAQMFLTTEQVARIVGPEGATTWVPYDRDAIQGEFDFTVEAGSTQPQNETFRRQSAMQLLDAMAPFISAMVVDPRKLAEHVLRNGFGIKDPSSFMLAPMPVLDPNTGQPMIDPTTGQPAVAGQMAQGPAAPAGGAPPHV